MNLVHRWAKYYLSRGISIIPLRPGDKRPACKWEEFKTRLATNTEIEQWFADTKNNIGIVTGALSGICAVDIDSADGIEAAKRYFPDLDALHTPTTKTPRGHHLLYEYPEDIKVGNHVGRLPDVDFRGEGGYIVAPPSINGDNDIVYKWHNRIDEFTFKPLPERYIKDVLVDDKFDKYLPLVDQDSKDQRTSVIYKGGMFQKGTRDSDLFHVAHCALKGGMAVPTVTEVLTTLAQNCNPPFSADETALKIKSALKRLQDRDRGLADEIETWVGSTEGDFTTSFLMRELALLPKLHKAKVAATLARLVEKGVLIKEARGKWRRIECACEEMDWEDADYLQEYDLEMPFGIQRLVRLMPGNIIVVAGATNSGKTAFSMNIGYRNVEKYDIHYFTSEMGPVEWRSRVERFDEPELFKHPNFHVYARSMDFVDVIRPTDINIIDYLEMDSDFWNVGGKIKALWDRLQEGGGLAIICLQKISGEKNKFSRGGEFSAEKARLYIALDNGVAQITKAKNWATETNPNGKRWEFKLVHGCNFMTKKEGSRIWESV